MIDIIKKFYYPTISKKQENKILKKIFLSFDKLDKVLDIGAGSQPYKKYFDYKEYIAFDIKNYDGINVIGDAQKLPFKDEKFDLILMIDLSYFADMKIVLNEVYRLLKPHGKAIITFIFMYPFLEHENDINRYTYKKVKFLVKNFKYEIMPTSGILGTFLNSFVIWTTKYNTFVKVLFFPFVLVANFLVLLDFKNKTFSTNYVTILQK